MPEIVQFDRRRRSPFRWLVVVSFIVGAFVAMSFIGAPAAQAKELTPSATAAQFEIRFMEQLSDHHLSGVKADNLCLQRAVHEDLRDMCAMDKANQMMQINQMVSWLDAWYGIHYQPRIDMSGRAMLSYLSTLRGNAFDIGYMETIIPHHIQAIMMAQTCLNRASHEQLIDLCQKVISGQRMEIREMRSWLCQWYDICSR